MRATGTMMALAVLALVASASAQCSGHGTTTPPDVSCQCNAGWVGTICEHSQPPMGLGLLHSCFGVPTATSGLLLKCGGSNTWGQLGQSTTTGFGSSLQTSGDNLLPIEVNLLNRYDVSDVDGGSTHTCMVVQEANQPQPTLRCFGGWNTDKANQMGDWGFEVAQYQGVGAIPLDMREPRFQPIDVGCIPEKVFLGGHFTYPEQAHTCVTCTNKQVKCFGTNAHGQLGTSSIIVQNLTVAGSIKDYCYNCFVGFRNLFLEGGTARTPTTASLAPLQFNGTTASVEHMSSGHLHTCAVTTGGAAYCFGNNDFGQCGVPSSNNAPEMPKEIDCTKDLNLLDCYPVDLLNEPDYGATATTAPPLTWTSIGWAQTHKYRPHGDDISARPLSGWCVRDHYIGWDHNNDQQTTRYPRNQCEGATSVNLADKSIVGVDSKALKSGGINSCRASISVSLGFVLPDKPVYDRVISAEMSVSARGSPDSLATFDIDLYGLDTIRPISGNAANNQGYVAFTTQAKEDDMGYSGPLDTNHTLLKQGFVKYGDAIPNNNYLLSKTVTFSGPQLVDWLNARYTAGGMGQHNFLRLSPDTAQGCDEGCQGTITPKPSAASTCGRAGNKNYWQIFRHNMKLNITFTECACGDGVGCGGETCDDGNAVSNDGCTNCQIDAGWTCKGTGASKCKANCGDGLRVGPETCDDGNSCNNDGCSRYCLVEPGFACQYSAETQADACTPVGNKDITLRQPHTEVIMNQALTKQVESKWKNQNQAAIGTADNPKGMIYNGWGVQKWGTHWTGVEMKNGNKCNHNGREYVFRFHNINLPQLPLGVELYSASFNLGITDTTDASSNFDMYAVKIVDNFRQVKDVQKGQRYDNNNGGLTQRDIGMAQRNHDFYIGPAGGDPEPSTQLIQAKMFDAANPLTGVMSTSGDAMRKYIQDNFYNGSTSVCRNEESMVMAIGPRDCGSDSGAVFNMNNHQGFRFESTYTAAVRFTGISIANGETVKTASMQFQPKENDDGVCTWIKFWAELSPNAGEMDPSSPIEAIPGNHIKDKTKTTAVVEWQGESCGGEWDKNGRYETPDLAPVIQEVVNQPGWVPGNAITILVESDASANRRVRHTISDEGRYAPILKWNTLPDWDQPGAGTCATTACTYFLYGPHFSTVAITDSIREKLSNGDDKNTDNNMWVGHRRNNEDFIAAIRFLNVNIPEGATLGAAYIEVRSKENRETDCVDLTFEAEAADNSAVHDVSGTHAISSRTYTTAKAVMPDCGGDGRWHQEYFYRSIDIGTVLQEVVDRPGWVQGNAITVKISAQNQDEAGSHVGNDYHRNFYRNENEKYGNWAPKLFWGCASSPGNGYNRTCTMCQGDPAPGSPYEGNQKQLVMRLNADNAYNCLSDTSSCLQCPQNRLRLDLATTKAVLAITSCTCGDHRRCFSEGCDDANDAVGDGCSDQCTVESGFSCTGGTHKTSDTCTPICGDGLRIGQETQDGYCDDGNPTDSDGCTACVVDLGYKCVSGAGPSVCSLRQFVSTSLVADATAVPGAAKARSSNANLEARVKLSSEIATSLGHRAQYFKVHTLTPSSLGLHVLPIETGTPVTAETLFDQLSGGLGGIVATGVTIDASQIPTKTMVALKPMRVSSALAVEILVGFVVPIQVGNHELGETSVLSLSTFCEVGDTFAEGNLFEPMVDGLATFNVYFGSEARGCRVRIVAVGSAESSQAVSSKFDIFKPKRGCEVRRLQINDASNAPLDLISSGLSAKEVAAGHRHTCVATTGTTVVCYGDNSEGQLGCDDAAAPGRCEWDLPATIISMSAGADHTCATTSLHELYCWGANNNGQLGRGDMASSGSRNHTDTVAATRVPVDVGSYGSHAPHLWQFNPGMASTKKRVVKVECGSLHTCAMLMNGDIKCWGKGSDGQLMQGSISNVGVATQQMGEYLTPSDLTTTVVKKLVAGSYHVCALLESADPTTGDGLLKCFGGDLDSFVDSSPMLGQPLSEGATIGFQLGEMGDRLWTVDVGEGNKVTDISAGHAHTCAIVAGAEPGVRCWGEQGDKLGIKAGTSFDGRNVFEPELLQSVDIPGESGDPATKIACGYDHTCALMANSSVTCFGEPSKGQLGYIPLENDTDTIGRVVWLGDWMGVTGYSQVAPYTALVGQAACTGTCSGTCVPSADSASSQCAMVVPDFTVSAGGLACTATVSSLTTSDHSSGSTSSLSVADGSLFAANDWIIFVEDDIEGGAVGSRHVLQITSVSANDLTIPPTTIVNPTLAGNAVVADGLTRQWAMVTKLCILTVNNGPDLQDTDSIMSNDGLTSGTLVGSDAQLTTTTYIVQRNVGGFTASGASTFTAKINNAGSSLVCGTCSVGDSNVNAATCSAGGTCAAVATQQAIIASIGPHVAQDICSGYEYSCALLADENVVCWGKQPGHPDLKQEPLDVEVTKIGSLTGPVKSISCGGDYACATMKGGSAGDASKIECWGRRFSTPDWPSYAVVESIDVGTGQGSIRVDASPVPLMNVTRIAANPGMKKSGNIAGFDAHFCVIDDMAGSVKCFGTSSSGQLGVGINVPEVCISGVQAMSSSRGFQDVVVGKDFSCGALRFGGVKCWGNTKGAQLRGKPGKMLPEMNDALPWSPLTICAAGRAGGAGIAANCVACPFGHYRDPLGVKRTTKACVECPLGTFSAVSAARSLDVCFSCTTGWYQSATGMSTCEMCSPGKFQGLEKQTECVACAPGKFQDAERATVCHDCDAGWHQPLSSATACLVCEAGTFQSAIAETTCDICTPGSFSQSRNATGCLNCNAGSHQPLSSATACLACEAGSFQTAVAEIVCDTCNPGSFSLPGDAACTNCKAGEFQFLPSQSSCLDCELGTFSPLQALTTCTSCEPGTFAPVTASPNCSVCLAGEYSVARESSCTLCSTGKFTDRTGTSACDKCEAGSYARFQGQEKCHWCPPGFFTEKTGKAVCLPCPHDRVISLFGMSQCIDCPYGALCNANVLQGAKPDYWSFQDIHRYVHFRVGEDKIFDYEAYKDTMMVPNTTHEMHIPLADMGQLPDWVLPDPAVLPHGPVTNWANIGGPPEGEGLLGNKTAFKFYKCLMAGCEGGPNSTCSEGYSGQFCAICVTSWYRYGPSCNPCPPFVPFVISAVIALIVCIIIARAFLKADVKKSYIMVRFKIMLGYSSTMSGMGAIFDFVPWPESMNSLFNGLSILNLDFPSLFGSGFGCFSGSELGFYKNMAMSLWMCPFIIGVIALYAMDYERGLQKKMKKLESGERKQKDIDVLEMEEISEDMAFEKQEAEEEVDWNGDATTTVAKGRASVVASGKGMGEFGDTSSSSDDEHDMALLNQSATGARRASMAPSSPLPAAVSPAKRMSVVQPSTLPKRSAVAQSPAASPSRPVFSPVGMLSQLPQSNASKGQELAWARGLDVTNPLDSLQQCPICQQRRCGHSDVEKEARLVFNRKLKTGGGKYGMGKRTSNLQRNMQSTWGAAVHAPVEPAKLSARVAEDWGILADGIMEQITKSSTGLDPESFYGLKIIGQRTIAKCYKNALLILFMFTPPVSMKIASLFVCDPMQDEDGAGGVFFMRWDYRVQCYTELWYWWSWYSWFGVLVYPVGVPVLFFVVLQYYKKEILNGSTKVFGKFGFLYVAYIPECCWWDCWETVRKLLLGCAIVFIEPGTPVQIIFALAVCNFATVFHAYYCPFITTTDNRLNLMCFSAETITLFYGLLIALPSTRSKFSGSDGGHWEYIILSINLLTVLCILLEMVNAVMDLSEILEDDSNFYKWQLPFVRWLRKTPCIKAALEAK